MQPSDAGDSAGHRQSSGRNTGGSATTEKPDSESPTSSTGSNAKSNELGPTDGRETPARQRNSNRREYMGQNPNKNSTTYRDVVARMREEGKIVGEGEKAMVKIPDGTWIPLKDAELAHTEDAMIYWNREGKYWGPKHPKVREFMTDPDNYVFDKPGSNRSAGARLKDVGYDPPDPRPGGPLSGAGAP